MKKPGKQKNKQRALRLISIFALILGVSVLPGYIHAQDPEKEIPPGERAAAYERLAEASRREMER
jgi:hypothetical protein